MTVNFRRLGPPMRMTPPVRRPPIASHIRPAPRVPAGVMLVRNRRTGQIAMVRKPAPKFGTNGAKGTAAGAINKALTDATAAGFNPNVGSNAGASASAAVEPLTKIPVFGAVIGLGAAIGDALSNAFSNPLTPAQYLNNQAIARDLASNVALPEGAVTDKAGIVSLAHVDLGETVKAAIQAQLFPAPEIPDVIDKKTRQER